MSYLLELNSMWRDRRRFISEGDMETLLCRDASDRNGGGGDGYIASYAAKYATALGDVNGRMGTLAGNSEDISEDGICETISSTSWYLRSTALNRNNAIAGGYDDKHYMVYGRVHTILSSEIVNGGDRLYRFECILLCDAAANTLKLNEIPMATDTVVENNRYAGSIIRIINVDRMPSDRVARVITQYEMSTTTANAIISQTNPITTRYVFEVKSEYSNINIDYGSFFSIEDSTSSNTDMISIPMNNDTHQFIVGQPINRIRVKLIQSYTIYFRILLISFEIYSVVVDD